MSICTKILNMSPLVMLMSLLTLNAHAATTEIANLQTQNLTKAQQQAETTHKNALSFLIGEDVKRDPVEAVRLFRIAAELGKKESQEQLALALMTGNGVGQDSIEAAKWAKKAAHQGSSSAQYLLADLYFHGDGVRQDRKTAFYWFKQSAKQGLVKSMSRIADMYIYGEGVKKDIYEGLFMYHRATINGDSWAKKRLAFLESQENCLLNATTKLYGRYLQCTDRKDFHFQLVGAGAKLLTSNRGSHYIYDSAALLNGSNRVEMLATLDKKIAKVVYVFNDSELSSMDDKNSNKKDLTWLKQMLEKKYGDCHIDKNLSNPGKISYKWNLADDVEINLQRKPALSTIELEYLIPDRVEQLAAMEQG